MIGATRPVGEDDLTAHVDGRLEPDRRALVDAYLTANPDQAAAIRADGELRTALRARLAPKAAEPVPARLRVAALLAERRRTLRRRMTWAAAACLCLALGGSVGWFARGAADGVRSSAGLPAAMAHEALSAHRTFAVEVVHPVEVKADQQTHLTQWLSKRLGRKLVIPDLGPMGLQLVGGRLLPAGRDVAAQLMYSREDGGRVTLYVRSGEHGETELKVAREGELSSAYWVDAGYGYALSAPVDRERLMDLARMAQIEMDAQGRTGPKM